MTDIIVRRFAGDRQGDDIVDGLLSTTAAAQNRGRNELDEQSISKSPIRYQMVHRAGVRLGQLVEVNDSLEGATFRGKITDITHRIQPTAAVTELTIERVSNF